ncbi:MAG: pyruvate, water dikinase [Desulfobacteraceae bacterium]|nr:MAG: pyruvate, water dikinase [Desulfobacteraceae bacterium]
MTKIMALIRKLFPGKGGRGSYDAETLRIAFRDRYHHFKLLLNANNKALAIMAEIGQVLKGTRPFGMSFVRSRCTAASTNVFQIVRNLNELAPGKYEVLFERFKEIQKALNVHIKTSHLSTQGPPVIAMEELNKSMADLVGSKLANLGEIRSAMDVKVPRGFAVTSSAYETFMKENDLQTEIDRLIQSSDMEDLDQLYTLSASIQQKIIAAPVPEEVKRTIQEHYLRLSDHGRKVTLAMRSSALGEDLPGASFAGQYRSELNVSGESILDSYKGILASKYGLSAMAYRLNRGIPDEQIAMCVGCMEMVDALSGGVVYSRNPLNIRDDSLVINAVWGLPKSVVDGSTACDLFVIKRGDPMRIIRKEVAQKDQKFVCYPEEGVCRLDLTGEQSLLQSITDEQALAIARLALKVEQFYRTPQDVEWALEKDGSIVLLQCRPLQQRSEDEKRTDRVADAGRSAKVVLKGGVTASAGVAAGPVFIVRKDVDGLKFPSGAILVAAQPLPRWAPLLNRAAAVVTSQGGIAGHLANVCREFHTPALFGLKEVLERVQTGETVTVDADGLTLYEGRVEEILGSKEEPTNLMQGSPVYESLKRAADLIVPLNLLDPDAPSFRPERCRTFHDITRYCHEKSVHEMFRFGKDHRFPERSSKQLLCEVPMQWWILNLDDGFIEEVEGRYVRLENIVSIPMRAIWEGITAMPWEGPPPVDGKGMMSVMFEATRNTALVTGVRSNYGNRNYFMISRNFCSLYSRLGFHFSQIEALVSERATENYISFQYKGGAADLERRSRRAFFIKELLEEYDFRTEVKEDTLIARLSEEETEFMKDRLRILGFLTIHTRQLDMIMANQASLQYYRNKITGDIRRIFFETSKGPVHSQ